ncbi:MAG: hypothetical protein EXS35_10585 [Pedosphaera sp.]|nr:hypothetical protein [Pedosphaera sp.]
MRRQIDLGIKTMKTLKKILLVLGVIVLALVVISQFLPSTYHIERSVVIAAKPAAIHPWINELKKWPEWSAWTAAKDPTLIYNYDGPESGVGAISKWEAKKMGQGQMKVIESDPAKGAKFDVAIEHGKFSFTGTFTFEPAGDNTKITWAMDGNVSRNPLDRFFSLLMDKFGGPDLAEGLGNLKKKVEGK